MVSGFVNSVQVTGWEGNSPQIKKQAYMKLKLVISFDYFCQKSLQLNLIPYNFSYTVSNSVRVWDSVHLL